MYDVKTQSKCHFMAFSLLLVVLLLGSCGNRDSVPAVPSEIPATQAGSDTSLTSPESTLMDFRTDQESSRTASVWGLTQVIDSTDNVGLFSSMATIDGNPAVAYYDYTNQELNYIRATDAEGTTWSSPQVVDTSGITGYYPSLTTVDGNPAISYMNATDGDLLYARADNSTGISASWYTTTVHSGGSDVVGLYTSMAIVNGNPAISFYDASNGNLKYTRSSNATGESATWLTVTPDEDDVVGLYTSLKVVNGYPAISYYDSTNGDLCYIRSRDASGILWNAMADVETPVTSNDQGMYTSLAIVDGNPAISYYNVTGDTLGFVRASDASGSSWGSAVTPGSSGNGHFSSLQVVNGYPAISHCRILTFGATTFKDILYTRASTASGSGSWLSTEVEDSTDKIGPYCSLAVINGNPAVCYYNETDGDLHFSRNTDVEGDIWGFRETPDSTGDVGEFSSLAIIDGYPAISYFDSTNDYLKFVRASSTDGSSWGTPVTVDSSGDVLFRSRLLEVNGVPAISYYDASNGILKYAYATSSSGASWNTLISVADDPDDEDDLGEYLSMAIVDGYPAIAYSRDGISNDALMYVRANNASGSSWPSYSSHVEVPSSGYPFYVSMAVVSGKPAVAYKGGINLRYVLSDDATGSEWDDNAIVNLAGTGLNPAGYNCNLLVVSGNPAICHTTSQEGLLYVRASNTTGIGSAWGTPVDLDVNGGAFASMAIIYSFPAISYYGSGDDLRIIRASDVYGSTWGDEAILDNTSDTGWYPSMIDLDDNAAISYHDADNGDLQFISVDPGTFD